MGLLGGCLDIKLSMLRRASFQNDANSESVFTDKDGLHRPIKVDTSVSTPRSRSGAGPRPKAAACCAMVVVGAGPRHFL